MKKWLIGFVVKRVDLREVGLWVVNYLLREMQKRGDPDLRARRKVQVHALLHVLETFDHALDDDVISSGEFEAVEKAVKELGEQIG